MGMVNYFIAMAGRRTRSTISSPQPYLIMGCNNNVSCLFHKLL
jgi:hypothetical protein